MTLADALRIDWKEVVKMEEQKDGRGRKPGSSILAGIIGFLLVVLAISIFLGAIDNLKQHRILVNGGSSLLFGIVLFWWAVSNKRQWGIGFETVTMVVGVVTAVIAILTLTSGP